MAIHIKIRRKWFAEDHQSVTGKPLYCVCVGGRRCCHRPQNKQICCCRTQNFSKIVIKAADFIFAGFADV